MLDLKTLTDPIHFASYMRAITPNLEYSDYERSFLLTDKEGRHKLPDNLVRTRILNLLKKNKFHATLDGIQDVLKALMFVPAEKMAVAKQAPSGTNPNSPPWMEADDSTEAARD